MTDETQNRAEATVASDAATSANENGARLGAIESSLQSLTGVVGELSHNLAIVQSSLQRLAGTVSGAAESLGAPRVRELYLRLLLLYDLVEPPPSDLPQDTVRFYRTLADQIEQFLAVNGVERIQSDGAVYDSKVHKQVGYIDDPDPANAGFVASTRRYGFQTERAVLRPSEVKIARLPAQPSTGISTPGEMRPPLTEADVLIAADLGDSRSAAQSSPGAATAADADSVSEDSTALGVTRRLRGLLGTQLGFRSWRDKK